MSWSLEIHHIDVVGRGDSTLILARGIVNGVKVQRSMLVDGGQQGAGTKYVSKYLRSTLGLTSLDVMVSTHYDDDHVNGLRSILASFVNASMTAKTIVYDQGVPVPMRLLSTRTENAFVFNRGGMETAPAAFFQSIGQRVHPTKNCFAAGCTGPLDESQLKIVDEIGDYLLGKELLWPNPNGPKGVYQDESRGPLDPNDAKAFFEHGDGRPTVRCIAANGYVLNGTGTPAHLMAPLTADLDGNGKSIALEVCFGTFRYYVGGDLTSLQEDGQASTVGLRGYLKKGGPLSAMKASHHGSKHSTSALFLNTVQPTVVVISNGLDNIYDHPDQETVNRLDSCAAVNRYFLTGSSIKRKPPLVLGSKGLYAGYSTEGEDGRQTPDLLGNVVITVDDKSAMRVHINGGEKYGPEVDEDDRAVAAKSYVYPPKA